MLGMIAFLSLVYTPPAAAGTRAPVMFLPKGPWNADFGETRCILRRTFAAPNGRELTLQLERYAPGSSQSVIVHGTAFAGRPFADKARFTPGPAGSDGMVEVSASKNPLAFVKAGDIPGLFLQSMRLVTDPTAPDPTPAQEAAIRAVTVQYGSMAPMQLMTGSLGRAMATVRQCTDALVGYWGYDATVQAALATRPVAIDPGTWLKPVDYPSKALSDGLTSSLIFRLDVDATGAATGCANLRGINEAQFAAATCEKLMQRARFVPARDQRGIAVPAYYIQVVNYI